MAIWIPSVYFVNALEKVRIFLNLLCIVNWWMHTLFLQKNHKKMFPFVVVNYIRTGVHLIVLSFFWLSTISDTYRFSEAMFVTFIILIPMSLSVYITRSIHAYYEQVKHENMMTIPETHEQPPPSYNFQMKYWIFIFFLQNCKTLNAVNFVSKQWNNAFDSNLIRYEK